MSFAAVAGVNNSQETSNTLTHTVNLPASIAAGDLILVFITFDGIPTTTWPTGWDGAAIIHSAAATGNNAKVEVVARIADGSEGSTITVTTGAIETSVHRTFRITGHSGALPADSTGVTPGSANSSPDPDSLTPGGGAQDFLWFAVAGLDNSAGVTLSSYPTNYSGNQIFHNAGAIAMAIATRELNATTEDPGAFTLSGNEQWHALTVAVAPAAGGHPAIRRFGRMPRVVPRLHGVEGMTLH